ncbi:MAG: PQQ-binding-like beta-propeller repeat protein [Verrucomicrobiae bacterium]
MLRLAWILTGAGLIGWPTTVMAGDPVAVWHADGSAEDSSGKGNHGAAIGTSRFAQGLSGQAFELNGLDEAIKTAIDTQVDKANAQSDSNSEWPQWRGPERNGAASFSPTLANAWPPNGPKKIWSSKPVSITPGPYAGGHSSPVIAGGKVYQYVADREGRHDIVMCLDAAHGTTKWTRRFEAPYKLMHGASATPCIVDNRVYIMGGRNAYCLDANTGTTVWLRVPLMTLAPNFPGDYLQEVSSSFVVGEGVAAVVVDKCAGLDLATGKTLWTTPSPGGYALAMTSPAFWSHEGQKYLIYGGTLRMCCVNPSNGNVVWEVTGDGQGGDHAHTPVVLDDYLICFWQGKLGIYRVSLDGPQCLYEAPMADKHSSPIAFKNRVYFVGCPDRISSTAVVCYNLETGELIWSHSVKNPEYSSPFLADNKIFLLTDQGKRLAMLDALNGKLLGECPIDAKPWASPAFAMGCLFVRKHDDGISCYDLTAKNNVSPRNKPAFAIKASASNVYQGMEEYAAEQAFDGDAGTRWATDDGTHQAWIAAEFS